MGVPGELLGKKVRCPHCKQVVLAPAAGTAAPAAPSAPAAIPRTPTPDPFPLPVPLPPPPPPAPPTPPAPVVVSAPEPVSPPASPPVAVTPPVIPPSAPEPSTSPNSEAPLFNFSKKKEGADSILSDENESEDEVFGSTPGPRLPMLRPVDSHGLPATDPLPVLPMVTPPTANAPLPATAELANPFADLDPAPVPAQPAPVAPTPSRPLPAPPAVPAPARGSGSVAPPIPVRPVAAAPPSTPLNPFADLDTTRAPAPIPAKVAKTPLPQPPTVEELPEDLPPTRPRAPEPTEKPARAGRAQPAPAAGAGSLKIALVAVIGYAVVMTALAVYGLFFKPSEKLDPGHPLSTIPDSFGEFDPASRKKVQAFKFPVDGELPAAQRASLGGKVTIGQLEIQPVKVERRPLVLVTESVSGKQQKTRLNPALVLTLSIKNTGDVPIYPMDPAFSRRQVSGQEKPLTRVVVGKQSFAGGFIEWPLDPSSYKKKIELQQEQDSTALKPGDTREYVVFTDTRAEVINAVETASDPVQWRVQVRRGVIPFRGKEIPVTAIIGVDFWGTDVKKLG